MDQNPLIALEALDQSIWLDYIRRDMLTSGTLTKYIQEDHLRGITSNPAIFQKAIADSPDYDDQIQALAQQGKSTKEIYQALTVQDIQQATDLFRELYDRTLGHDGYVSLEVSPHFANDTQATLDEARMLWKTVNRPNVMIKVPGTNAGLPAIRQLISEGINVNVTLLFGVPRYREVLDAYWSGLEDRVANGQPIDQIASVASFFLSRIGLLVDPMLEKKVQAGGIWGQVAQSVLGQVEIASAKVAYQIYLENSHSHRVQTLRTKGALSQRLLWASTSTKNPSYSDVRYVEALIGPETVDTVPLETYEAYRDHGKPQVTLTQGVLEAYKVLENLSELGLSLAELTQQLEDEGIQKFIDPFEKLMASLEAKRMAIISQTAVLK